MIFKPIEGKIINRRMLSDNILELSIEFFEDIKILAGQWVGFLFNDEIGNFIRPYSIAYHERENNVTDCIFLIKILENGRATKIINGLKIGDKININGVFGNFVLQDSENEKIFIATGTGIAPIINMIRHEKKSKKKLFFGVQYKKDIIREDKIKKIENLDYKIFLSREDLGGYEYGRIDLNKFDLNKDMEFYICGAPPVVEGFVNQLKLKGFDKIYYEQFF